MMGKVRKIVKVHRDLNGLKREQESLLAFSLVPR